MPQGKYYWEIPAEWWWTMKTQVERFYSREYERLIEAGIPPPEADRRARDAAEEAYWHLVDEAMDQAPGEGRRR